MSAGGNSPNKETFHLYPRLWLMQKCNHLFICKCEWACVCVYVCVCLPVPMPMWSVCDPECHYSERQTPCTHLDPIRWAEITENTHTHRHTHTHSAQVLNIWRATKTLTQLLKCHHSFIWSKPELQLQAVRQIPGLKVWEWHERRRN